MHNQHNCPGYTDRRKYISELVSAAINQAEAAGKKKKLVWLELNGCSGNIISLLDGFEPNLEYMMSAMTDFMYCNSLIAKEGNAAMEQLFSVIGSDFILAVEGAVSKKDNGLYNIIGRVNGMAVTGLDAVTRLGEAAEYVIAVGACASHGGVSGARPNPAECVGVQKALKRRVINCPGCPCNPDWFLGTLAYILLYGEPPLDSRNRPQMFYSITIHDRCPRRSYFDNNVFAEKLGDETCMFKLGCRGPVTPIDCPVRMWNNHVNWPVKCDTPCIGCAQFGFPDAMEPFITYNTTR